MDRGIMNGSVERQIQLRRDFCRIDMMTGRDNPMIHQALARFGGWRLCQNGPSQLSETCYYVHSRALHTGRSLLHYAFRLKAASSTERSLNVSLARRMTT